MAHSPILSITHSWPAIISLGVFFLCYVLVIFEEYTQLQKSKPLLLASSIIWILTAFAAEKTGQLPLVHAAIQHNLTDFVELLLFILVAITYVNVLTERNAFEALRAWLTTKGFSYRQLYWMTGILAFFLSPLVDNLTTALALSAVILTIGKDNSKFTSLACINLVVAANAGGVFSPFGDITTLMVWQAGIIPFFGFLKLFVPAVLNYMVPALCLQCAIPKGKPSLAKEMPILSTGAKDVIVLFFLTIFTTVLLQQLFKLPPAIGMMLGLGYLQLYAYYTKRNQKKRDLDVFPAIKNLDWDTLLFFYGIILCIGGLATLGYLQILSHTFEVQGHTAANILIGLLSAVIDNIPLMFAVITMDPTMSEGQWLLLTLTTGVGGSLLSIGSAAGVAVMGQARGIYTFFTHLKWAWAIALGYMVSIIFHLWWNASLF